MATIIFTNFATTVIDVGISDSDISVAVASGAGALFPNPGVDEYAILAMENSGGVKEIVHLTERSGDTFTILRAQEGTAAAAFIAGSRIEVRMTAGWLGALPAKSDVQNATLTHVTSVAGTNTITGTLPAPFTDYAAGQEFTFVPANTNTGVTTVNWSGFGAKAVQANGAALVGGELVNGVPTRVYYDGAAFQLVAFNTSSNGQSLISAANYAAMRALFSPLTTNGDLWTRTGGVDARIALGATNGMVLGRTAGALGYVHQGMEPVEYADLTNGGANNLATYELSHEMVDGYRYHLYVRNLSSTTASWLPVVRVRNVAGTLRLTNGDYRQSEEVVGNLGTNNVSRGGIVPYPSVVAAASMLSFDIVLDAPMDATVKTTGQMDAWLSQSVGAARAIGSFNVDVAAEAHDQITISVTLGTMDSGKAFLFRIKEPS